MYNYNTRHITKDEKIDEQKNHTLTIIALSCSKLCTQLSKNDNYYYDVHVAITFAENAKFSGREGYDIITSNKDR